MDKIFNFIDSSIGISFKRNFIEDNYIIIQFIKAKLSNFIIEKLDEQLLHEKIIIYNQNEFEKIMAKIKVLISQNHIKELRKISSDNFNILLLGQTNVGKSTLINEFLKLENKLKAKEGQGRETLTIDFTSYVGKRNNQKYTLYDTNGITLQGDNSIENKKQNTSKEIKERIKKKNPNELIHCIWYCLTGSSVQEADKGFIEELLNIYTIHKIPIIFVHTKSYSKDDCKDCKNGLKDILQKIFKGDELEVKKYLKKYIKVLAREDDKKEDNEESESEENQEAFRIKPFGLEKLEKISRKEIIEEGQKSSYYEYIKQNVLDILINTAFKRVFHHHNIRKLMDVVANDINKYLNTILKILDDDKLKLGDDIKNNNKISLIKMSDSFKNVKDDIKVQFKDYLSMNYLKKDNEKFIKEIYECKSDKYKNEMNFNDYKKNVENLIYDNIANNSNEIINNLINLNFNVFILQVMKNGLKEQFKQKEEEYIKEIYSELFKDN